MLSVMSDTAKIYVKVVEATNIAADVGERVGKENIRWDSVALVHLFFKGIPSQKTVLHILYRVFTSQNAIVGIWI